MLISEFSKFHFQPPTCGQPSPQERENNSIKLAVATTVCVCASVLHSGFTGWVKLTNTLLPVTQSTHWKIIHKLWRLNTDVLVPVEKPPIRSVTNKHWSDIDYEPLVSC